MSYDDLSGLLTALDSDPADTDYLTLYISKSLARKWAAEIRAAIQRDGEPSTFALNYARQFGLSEADIQAERDGEPR